VDAFCFVWNYFFFDCLAGVVYGIQREKSTQGFTGVLNMLFLKILFLYSLGSSAYFMFKSVQLSKIAAIYEFDKGTVLLHIMICAAIWPLSFLLDCGLFVFKHTR